MGAPCQRKLSLLPTVGQHGYIVLHVTGRQGAARLSGIDLHSFKCTQGCK